MKYFTKYIPVEGEINPGTLVRSSATKRVYTYIIGEQLMNAIPVKLFLCSRDIKVGDKAWTTVGNCFDTFKEGYDKQYWFKVIGEISPDALGYVKEGMEYEEFDYRYKDTHGWDIVDDISIISEEYRRLYKIGIKGPCGHFH